MRFEVKAIKTGRYYPLIRVNKEWTKPEIIWMIWDSLKEQFGLSHYLSESVAKRIAEKKNVVAVQ